MQVIALSTLKNFWSKHPPSQRPLRAWYTIADKSEWHSPGDIKRQFGNGVDFVGDNRVIFDIGGNKYRLVVHVSYEYRRVLIKFVGTHGEYDRIDAETIR